MRTTKPIVYLFLRCKLAFFVSLPFHHGFACKLCCMYSFRCLEEYLLCVLYSVLRRERIKLSPVPALTTIINRLELV